MSDKIKEAVSKLDPANPNHWTQDGLPRLDTVKLLASDPSITRDDINAALPGFVRPVPPAPPAAPAAPQAPIGNTPEQGGTLPPIPAPAAPPAPTPEDPAPLLVAASLSEQGETREQLEVELEELNMTISEGERAVAEANIRIADFRKKADAISDKIARLEKANGENPTQMYLRRQRADLEKRAERLTGIRESGVNFNDIFGDLKAPIDQRLESRRRQR